MLNKSIGTGKLAGPVRLGQWFAKFVSFCFSPGLSPKKRNSTLQKNRRFNNLAQRAAGDSVSRREISMATKSEDQECSPYRGVHSTVHIGRHVRQSRMIQALDIINMVASAIFANNVTITQGNAESERRIGTSSHGCTGWAPKMHGGGSRKGFPKPMRVSLGRPWNADRSDSIAKYFRGQRPLKRR